MNTALWQDRASRLLSSGVEAAIVVQCELDWLRPERLGLRNEIDEAVLTAQLRRGSSLRITRVILHNLPASTRAMADADAVAAAFDEWNYRLAATSALLSAPTSQVHRLIIPGDQTSVPVPDMVDLLEDSQWCDPQNADLTLRTVGATGATTPLTSYDVDLQGPFSDGDPSIHM
ncbi:hypothetical protein OG210_20375 [Streptomyces sp. NBC_00466]|uniref:hypothetical protein n=1 Tax=Streptomyces sp. NBC_00466 TaxID=2903655 RepID=UPI0030DFE588